MYAGDPLIRIAQAVEANEGPQIASVGLTDMRINGALVRELEHLVNVAPAEADIIRGLRVQGDTLVCEIACTFGTVEGEYRFRVSAPGYRSVEIVVESRFEGFEGGCPGQFYGSPQNVAIILERL
jgi:hypothetical protein